ncbi:hypothetical protein L21SP5_00098 [Salinivirga cyanobacteriivorans]|uniref:YARHG domain-containing protein n=1 Tax=Salinivirga cyanobacteriivorans TaxID=1307839 RepID=A0A0S2HUX1_9BACT|nr:YARHG domain-containing protein [Salinivirga cyanobacteriivorans]ALO13780.1 hypothetical protein L21SP5_00098 [Salinivirga cyanobacteriivorans]
MKFLYVILLLICLDTYSQDFVGISNDFEFIGMDSNLIYRCNDYQRKNYNKLFKIKDFYSNNGVLSKLEKQPNKRQVFISSNVSVFNYKGIVEIHFKDRTQKLDYSTIDKNISYDNNILYCSFLLQNNYFLTKMELSERERFDIEMLPLFGRKPTFNKGYIYFGSPHICNWYSSETEDVYRVKIGQWDNPELVLANVVPGSWFIIPETEIIYAKIDLKEKGKGILWNIKSESYAIINEVYSKEVIRYQNRNYYEIKPNGKPISFREVVLPKEFPHKDVRNLCYGKDRLIVNMPKKEKSFSGTFITESLLSDASTEELQKLSKGQLRKLRNAFFARQGYQFNSKDLQEFFGQFDWYHEMVERNQFYELSNDQVVISPQDKKRVELIMEVEQGK